MANVHDELLDHEYDGIREYDNPLPRWWVWLFYGTIVFSVIYIPYYYLGYGPSSAEMYEEEVAEAAARMQTPAPAPGAAPGGQGSPGGAPAAAVAPATADLSGDPEAIAAGNSIFQANCMPCHGASGEGSIGPNLTDNFWLHGNTYGDVVNVITEGVPAKGMVPWKSTLNPTKIAQVAAFVVSLKGTNPPNAKEPQGQEYPE